MEGGQPRLGRLRVEHGEGGACGIVDQGRAAMEAQPGARRPVAQRLRQPDRRLVIGEGEQGDGARQVQSFRSRDGGAELVDEARLGQRREQRAEGGLGLEDRVLKTGRDGGLRGHQAPRTSVKKSTLVAAALREASSRAAAWLSASRATPP